MSLLQRYVKKERMSALSLDDLGFESADCLRAAIDNARAILDVDGERLLGEFIGGLK